MGNVLVLIPLADIDAEGDKSAAAARSAMPRFNDEEDYWPNESVESYIDDTGNVVNTSLHGLGKRSGLSFSPACDAVVCVSIVFMGNVLVLIPLADIDAEGDKSAAAARSAMPRFNDEEDYWPNESVESYIDDTGNVDCDKLGNPVLQLDEVAFRYSKETPYIFQKVCIGSRSDSRICIVGENGAGKTTLLKLLLGDYSPTNGTRSANRRLNIGYFTQHHVDQLDLDDSPLELLAQRFPGLGQEEYRAAMGRFGLSGDIAFQSIATLSGGQKSRLAFTCLSLQQPNYLVMDEPTNHLDVETVDALGKALNDFKGGVVLVSHDERLIELVCKELWVCKDKTVTQLDGGLEEYKKHVYRQLAIQ
ncbi:hypothetical protein niasHT_015976 [Heterodera trifolii]|uniref:ABC transporter domain-containing protein n=1 Tax=Heterodera trifolii TaxID=157864 RepID=A0ABD2KUS9_9BILA